MAEKAIPEEYKNETEQIGKATAEVKEQIREIILNTKQEAANINTIAEAASSKMAVLNQDISSITDSVSLVMGQTVQVRELAESIKQNGEELGNAIQNVARRAGEAAEQSGSIMDRAEKQYETSRQSAEKVISIYQETKEEMEQAIEDSRRVGEINALTEEILAISSQTNLLALNASIEVITELVREIAESMQKMNQSAENSNENSGAVMKQMEELFRLSELLNRIVASFRV